MLDEKTQECMLSPKGFNKFHSDGVFANCCGKQPTELANEVQKILDELEKHRGAGPDSVHRRPEESVESEDSIVADSGSNQTASSHLPTEKTQIRRKENDLPLPPPLQQTPFRRMTCINHASRIFIQEGILV